ncbi:Na+/H+ antiporter NhaA [Mariprofundus erugo]|uniref:Na(+)/H(+) antiporter NhaA n=1 Tax=Mariprofundus erugo TaxID=2528639 RepID=A0A5R9GZF6_9PROT|nr:Na+/H+ antiporter NhaA [Mariprofundus erugo]TLS68234.1 Na+/H+ antiporter NhaA [Mariprofundus erugo]
MSRPSEPTTLPSFFAGFLKLEAAGGMILMFAAICALLIANSPLQSWYTLLLDLPVGIRFGALEIAKPLLLWINDGLMAIFFFLVGLELKRELIEGELSDRRNILLPAAGALGGMAIPALIYILFNRDDSVALQGWAIPAATDIAFALGVLALLGSRVPTAIKIFLTSLAIFDDIGAIIIIAIFYTAHISMIALTVFACCIPVLAVLNRLNVTSKALYIMVGMIMWVAMLKSGVHATLAGVVLAMFIPMRSKENPDYSPLKDMEHDLHAAVAFFILPLFAFANAGISFAGIGSEQLLHSVPLGIALGLFLGKQIGVFTFCWLAIKSGITALPKGMSWPSLYATAVLCGIGFTMSLFIGSLAFEETGVSQIFDERLGIILGSLLSGITGYLLLQRTLPAAQNRD